MPGQDQQSAFDDDPISARILRILERRGRMPNQQLAAEVGLSPSACLRRVQDLERRGEFSVFSSAGRRAYSPGMTRMRQIIAGIGDAQDGAAFGMQSRGLLLLTLR